MEVDARVRFLRRCYPLQRRLGAALDVQRRMLHVTFDGTAATPAASAMMKRDMMVVMIYSGSGGS